VPLYIWYFDDVSCRLPPFSSQALVRTSWLVPCRW